MKKGFTLVEVMVVLSVLGLLAAIILPAFVMIRERERQFTCQSNAHQLGIAMLQYAADYDGVLPAGTQLNPQSFAFGEGWAGQVFPNVRNTAVFRCPDDPAVPIRGASVVSYGYNAYLPGPIQVKGKLSRLPFPAKTVLLFETKNCLAKIDLPDEGAAQGAQTFSPAGGSGLLMTLPKGVSGPSIHGQYATGWFGGCDPGSERTWNSERAGRHNGGANYVLCDGHVRWLRPEQVLDGRVVASAEAFDHYAARFVDRFYPHTHYPKPCSE